MHNEMFAGNIAAFSAGVLGGFGHCIGMCGPIVASYSLHGSSSNVASRIIPHLFYNTGRVSTYVFLGALMGAAGSAIQAAGGLSGVQSTVAVFAGVMMIVMGLNIAGLLGRGEGWEGKLNFIYRAGGALARERSLWKYYPMGAVFGLLPCGMSYSVFVAAAGTGSLLSGMLLALSFGLGTVPALVVFGITASYISSRLRGVLYRLAGFVIILMGLYFLAKGIKH